MKPWSAEAWLAAWHFAARAHQRTEQKVPGSDLPYLTHVGAVAMEVARAIAVRLDSAHPVGDPDLALQCALLHDVVEDTELTLPEIEASFGAAVASGVSALTKDPAAGDKRTQTRDSLARILAQPPEVAMVKLADRITNLQPPPSHWPADRVREYRDEAREIHAALGAACPVLGPRLRERIEAYGTV